MQVNLRHRESPRAIHCGHAFVNTKFGSLFFFFFQAEDGIRDGHVTGVQTCALPIWQLEPRAGTGAQHKPWAEFEAPSWIKFSLSYGTPFTLLAGQQYSVLQGTGWTLTHHRSGYRF